MAQHLKYLHRYRRHGNALYLGGGATGNVYYLDGVRDIDLSWVKSGTLRFDQLYSQII